MGSVRCELEKSTKLLSPPWLCNRKKNQTEAAFCRFVSTVSKYAKLIFVISAFSLPARRLVACLCALFTLLSTHSLTVYALSIEQREAYFNGSAYLRLKTPMQLWGHSAISFRTCRGKFDMILCKLILYWCLTSCVWIILRCWSGNIADDRWTGKWQKCVDQKT